jgi:hypothetical protein
MDEEIPCGKIPSENFSGKISQRNRRVVRLRRERRALLGDRFAGVRPSMGEYRGLIG